LVARDLGTGRLLPVLPHLEFGNVNIVPIYPTRHLLELASGASSIMVEELRA
jgi:hypothetical protein